MITEADKCRLLIEHSPCGFGYHRIVLDDIGNPVDFIFLDVNEAFEKMTGLKKNEIIGQKATQVLPGIRESEFDWIGSYGEVASTGKTLVFEQYIEQIKRWFDIKVFSNETGFFVTILNDITESKNIEKGLEYQLRFQRLISDISSSFVNTPLDMMDTAIDEALKKIGLFFDADRCYVFVFSPDGNFMENTHEWCTDGIEPQVNRMKNFPVRSIPWWTKQIKNMEQIEVFDVNLLPPEAKSEKEEFQYQGIQSLLSLPMVSDNKLFGFFGIDYVQEKRSWTKEQLSLLKIITEILANAFAKMKSETEKHMILNSISESVSYMDTELHLIWANKIAADSVGKRLDDMYGQCCYKLWNDLDEPCPDCPATKVIASKQAEEGIVVTRYNRIRYVQCYPTFSSTGEIIGIVKVATDITEQKQMEKELSESENRFRQLVEMAPDAIYVQVDKRFRYVNQAAVKLFGAKSEDELLGTYVMDRFHPDFYDLVSERIHMLNNEKKNVPRLEEVYLKLDGTPVDVEVAAVPIKFHDKDGALVYVRDISERKELERRRIKEQASLRQQQKLEAIGVLASGVAHEINNPINGIMNYAQLILDNDQDAYNSEYAREIINETERVSAIVSNLLRFSRQEKQSHSPARIEDIISRTLSLIRTLFRRDQITVQLHIPQDLPSIKCRSQQIEQVFMNMMTNARDALNTKYPGYHEDKVIRVLCSLFERDGRRWLRLTIEDKGPGIPPEYYEKIFEPFFTSKPRDKGTGLGLSISYGIVKDHHGEISFESQLGEYTRFHIDLPVDNGWILEPEDE